MELFYKKLKISKKEFLFQYQSHPNYPSALAFSDTLNFLNLKNEAYEIEKEFWHKLPKQFIVVYENKFAFVEQFNSEFLLFTDKKEKISKEKLYTNSENIVFIFEEAEKDYIKKINYKFCFFFFILFALLISFFNSKFSLFFFNLLSSIGLYISLELFQNKFGEKSIVINNLCKNDNNNLDVENRCNKIFGSDKVNFFGLKLSDFSLFYFISLFILGILIPESTLFLKYVSYLSIFVVFYSLFIQFFKEKSMCKICLLIITILVGQMVIGSLFFFGKLNINLLAISVIIPMLILNLIIYLNDILKQKEEFYLISLKNTRFKKNYDIFKKELIRKYVKLSYNDDEFFIGNKKSKLKITIITNPYCGYCNEVYLIVEKLIKKYPEISINFRFNYFKDNNDENLTLLISIFRNIYKSKGDIFLLKALKFWHINSDIKSFKKEYETFIYETDLTDIIELAEENKLFELTFTPQILINHYLFPHIYERQDIFYFIDELLEDDDF